MAVGLRVETRRVNNLIVFADRWQLPSVSSKIVSQVLSKMLLKILSKVLSRSGTNGVTNRHKTAGTEHSPFHGPFM